MPQVVVPALAPQVLYCGPVCSWPAYNKVNLSASQTQHTTKQTGVDRQSQLNFVTLLHIFNATCFGFGTKIHYQAKIIVPNKSCNVNHIKKIVYIVEISTLYFFPHII